MRAKIQLNGVRNTNTKKILLSKAKLAKKKLRGDFTPFFSKSFKIREHFFTLLLPKNSKSVNICDIRFWEMGAIRRLTGTSKVNRQTDRHTDRDTYGQINL